MRVRPCYADYMDKWLWSGSLRIQFTVLVLGALASLGILATRESLPTAAAGGEPLATADTCSNEPDALEDEIYFLSCGGIF